MDIPLDKGCQQEKIYVFKMKLLKTFSIGKGRANLSYRLIDLLKNHFFGGGKGHLKGIPFNEAHDNPTPLGIDSKLRLFDVPDERDFLVAYLPGAISVGLELDDCFHRLRNAFTLGLVNAGELLS
jgi:hypothetical protein